MRFNFIIELFHKLVAKSRNFKGRTFLFLSFGLFFLPVSKDISSFLIGVLFIHSFTCADFKNYFVYKSSNLLVILFFLFFLIYCFSGIHSHNLSEYRFEIEKKLSYIILPFAFLFISVSDSNKFRLLSVFAYSSVFWLLYCIVCSVNAVVQTRDISYLYMDKLADWIGMLRVYFSLYLFFSVVILWFDFQENRGNRKLTIASLVFCLFGMLLFMSRIQLPLLLFFACLAIFRYFNTKGKALIGLLFMFSLLIGFVAMIYFVKPLNRQFIGAVEKFDRKYAYTEEANGVNERIVMWDCSIQLIKENPWFGVGVGDLYDDLTVCYRSLNLLNKDRAPSHNQYLQVLVSLGVFGFLIFISILLVFIYDSYRSKDAIYQAFILILCLSFFTESILELQKGIVFFVLVGLIFYSSNKSKAKSIG